VDRADGSRHARGQSAGPRRTVRGALADSPPGPTGTSDSRRLRVFTVGIQTRTVHGVRVFDITASNGKGEYKYSKPRLGGSLLAL
jgi:hypothetical protein